LPSNTQGGSPVRETRSPGSVRGVLSNGHSYRDRPSKDHSTKRKRSRTRLQLVLRQNGYWKDQLLCDGGWAFLLSAFALHSTRRELLSR